MQFGFIGLGDQGGAMAKMILQAGLPLGVWARKPAAVAPFVAEGASAAESAAALAAQCDVLSICVTTDADVREVVFDYGVLDAMRPNSVIAIHSTVLPSLSIEIQAAAAPLKVGVLDAPVSGSARAALNKTLLVMVGGTADNYQKALPAFEAYGNPIFHIGACGMAMQTKLINNVMAAAHKGVAIRALRTATNLGLDAKLVQNVVLSGVGRSMGLEIVGRLQDPARARHICGLVKKDMALAREALPAKELAPLFALADEAIAAMTEWSEGRALLFAEG